MSGDTLTMADIVGAYDRLAYESRPRRSDRAESMLDGISGGLPIRFSKAVPIDRVWMVKPGFFPNQGILVMNPAHDPEQKRRYALLRESLTFLHRLVMG